MTLELMYGPWQSRWLLFIVAFLACWLGATLGSGRDLEETDMSADTIKIIGRLSEVPNLSVKCGDTAVATVFKFDVVSVL